MRQSPSSRSSLPAHVSVECAFCGYQIPTTPVPSEAGVLCCSEHCRDAYEAGDEPFAGRVGFKRFSTGVAALDDLLPQGIPANSFVLLAGEEGIRHRGLQTELVWRALRRGEPAVVISFVDPPIAVVEHFFTFGWNVLPYLESGQLQVVDCFTSRLREEHRSPEHQVPWNEFLRGALEEAVTVVRDTGDLRETENRLHECLVAREMVGTGLVVVDSLNEVEIQGQGHETEQFVKEIRGDVCARKFVPIFASTTGTEDRKFAREHAYLFDGIVQMRRNDSLVEGAWLKELGIRKMDGVPYRPHWVAYENTGRGGFRTFDPETEFASMYGYRPGQSGPPEQSRRSQPPRQPPQSPQQ